MNLYKRIFAALLVLCMVLPMMLLNVAADTAQVDNSKYVLFHEDLNSLTYNDKGYVSLEKNMSLMNSLYTNGEIDMVPYSSNVTEKYYINSKAADKTDSFPFDGLKRQNSVAGDWFAFKFRSPGTGLYSMNLETYYLNKNNASTLAGYLLPARTAASSIPALLTEENKIGLATIPGELSNFSDWSAQLTSGVELEANKEYILVIQIAQDGYEPAKNRVDFMPKGLSFGEGYKQGEGAFGPVSGVEVADNFITYAEYYRAASGKNRANGHDLVYLLFKGGTMIVYDVDDREIYDVETGLTNTLWQPILDKEGNLWIAASGAIIQKYDPTTGITTKYSWGYEKFDANVKGKTGGMVFGDDGYLYFAYSQWLGRMDPKTGNVECISQPLTSDPNKASDTTQTGYGGLVYRDGYLYLALHGDLNNDTIYTSEVIKYDIANRKIVQAIDVRDVTWSEEYHSAYGINYLDCIDGVLFGTLTQRTSKQIYIDITGDEMVRMEKIEGFDSCLIGRFTDELDGKYYATGYVDMEEGVKCLYEYDPATRTMTRRDEIIHLTTLFLRGAVVTVEDDPLLPGNSLVTAQSNNVTGKVDLCFYNMQTEATVFINDVSGDYGSPSQLHSIELDPTGRYLYAGAYGTNKLAKIDLQTGEITTRPTHNHQIDGMYWYDGYLWVGNYSTGTITRFDPETEEITPLFELMGSVFQNKRMWNFTAGDNKVFCATVPDTGRMGGVLVWYDIDKDLTYVAAGPNPEDVYYADTTASFVVWYSALTGKVETFDDDGDGVYDYDILVDDKGTANTNDDVYKQRFYGVVENRVLCSVNYVDGYIVGSTTKYNGSQTQPSFSEGNAEIFVYDLNAMKLLATCDVSEHIDGLISPNTGYVDAIDVVRPDPYEKGKYWGVVCDTLFSFTFDFATNTFHVKEELSLAKNVGYGITQYGGRHMLFDGDYVIVSFHNKGTYMVNTSDTSKFYQIAVFLVDNMKQLPNGDILYIGGKDGSKYGVRKFEIAQYTQPLVAQSVQAVIDALPAEITLENEEQFMAAYKMYMDLSQEAKDMVNAEKLLSDADALAPQQIAKAEALINAIGEVTLESEAAIRAARIYYNSLPESLQAQVSNYDVLKAAEDKLFELKQPKPVEGDQTQQGNTEKNNTVLFILIGAAAVVVIAAVAAVILIRKKKTQKD